MSSENGVPEAVKSTLAELDYLHIKPDRLAMMNNSRLGEGGFGVVDRAMLDNSREVAVKQLQIKGITEDRVAKRFARELKVWAKMKHPNILELLGYLSENYTTARFVSPYMANGNVTEYMKKITPTMIEARLKLVWDITSGMAYLHNYDPPICHGDLKPANVLISDEPSAVLCDFGLAAFVENSGASSGLTTSSSVNGSPRYMSPELLEGGKRTLDSDVWAWACTVFEILTDIHPYSASKSDKTVIAAVVMGVSPDPTASLSKLVLKDNVPLGSALEHLQNIIPLCWNATPGERPTLSSILERLDSFGLQNLVLPGPPNQEPDQSPRPVSFFRGLLQKILRF